MGKYLDLDDVAAGNPVAKQELRELRERNAMLEEETRRFYRGDGSYEILESPEAVKARRIEAARKLATQGQPEVFSTGYPDEDALIRAMQKAVELGVFPKHVHEDAYLDNWKAMQSILAAAHPRTAVVSLRQPVTRDEAGAWKQNSKWK